MHFGKRRQYLIRKDFQFRFILRFVAAATVWGVTSVLLFVYLAWKKLDALRYSSHIDIQTTSELLIPVTLGVHAVSLLIFAGILTCTIHALWQKLSQPLTVIKNGIVRIADGDLTVDVVLRKSDEFRDLAGELDEMRQGMRERMTGVKDGQRELSAAAAELERSIREGKPSLSAAAALQSAVVRMEEKLHAFHFASAAASAATARPPVS